MVDLVEEYVDKLGCSIAEAKDMIEKDKRIDKGEKLFELTPEQKKVVKAQTNVKTHKKPVVYKFDKKQRKENVTKKELIIFLRDALNDYVNLENLEITNAERQIAFGLGGENFELTLVQKRKKK